MKKCPFCAEEIQDAAIVCRYCNRELSPPKPETITCPFCKAIVPKNSNVCPSCHDDISGITGEDRVSTTTTPAPPSAIGRRQGLRLLALGIGFLLTFVSSASAGVGIFMMWFGLAFALKGGAIVRWGGGFILALILGSIGMGLGGTATRSGSSPASSAATGSPTTSARTAPAPQPTYQLALISARGYESEYGGYHYVEGQVKNISDESLKNVTAVATWYDKDGNFIKSDDAIIDYNPILPGQTSPFKTISSGNPAMSKFSVEFKTLLGGALRVDDQRKR